MSEENCPFRGSACDDEPKEGDKTPLLVNEDRSTRQNRHRSTRRSKTKDNETAFSSSDSEEDYRVNGVQNRRYDSPRGGPTPWFVYYLTFFSAIGGFLFGYDTGVVSGAMLLVDDDFLLSPLWHEMVVSVTIGAAAVFALIGGIVNDGLGRKPTTLMASFVFTVGASVLAAAQNAWMLLGGRFLLGIGIGFASTTVPMYIAESAPSHLRGRLVTLNNIFITGGQCVASVIDGAFCFDHKNGWRYMLGLAGLPSLVQFIGFMFMPESPRWLVKNGQVEKATMVLSKIRGTEDVGEEIDSIKTADEEDKEARLALGNTLIIVQMLKTPQVRRALIVGCCLQMFQQLAGINTVMYYSATIIKLAGVEDECQAVWYSAITALANFTFTFVGLWLVEKVGRRTLTLGSLGGTVLSLALLAVGFQLAANYSPSVSVVEGALGNDSCGQHSWCNDCMVDPSCGYCYVSTSTGAVNGSCLPTNGTGSVSVAGRCAGTHLPNNLHWAYDFCPTNYSWMALAGLVIYLAFFAPGMGPMPWTINSEIYPLWARSTGNAITTATNWIFNLFISLTFLTLTQVLTRYGAFWLYTGLAAIGWLILFFILRETKNKTLEQLENLYTRPWC
ncbi:proton myo-inositol cotransporter [Lingula anatina]|uniref:Proton myo-inositol cotransporter n=1 Tax=Lingula anatina TaxID=7574 RepID=A0A1S3J6Y0_LINAN|nr:proton myo-inositol cotransporter [Lingula anatina]|eukprot:XP_013406068.1 proton myo-inositol cotransporter [Lingula anatina]